VLSESIRHRENVFKDTKVNDQSQAMYGFSENDDVITDLSIDDEKDIDSKQTAENDDILELGSDIEEAPEDYESLELEQNDIVDEDIFSDDEAHVQNLDGLVKNNDVPIDTDINDSYLNSMDPFENRGIKQKEPVEDQEYLGVDGDTELEDFDDIDDIKEEPQPVLESTPHSEPNTINNQNPSGTESPAEAFTQPQEPQKQELAAPQPQAPVYIMAQGSQEPAEMQSQTQDSAIKESETSENEDCSDYLDEGDEIDLVPDFDEEIIEDIPLDSDDDTDVLDDIDDTEKTDPSENSGFLALAEAKKEDAENTENQVLNDDFDELEDYLKLDDELISDEELEDSKEHLELSNDEIIMDKVRSVLNEVWETPPIKPFATTSQMFSGLRDLCKYLPSSKYNEFMESLERMKLDYVISRLAGRPGLLAAAQTLREKGAVKTPKIQLVDEESINDTLAYMRTLVDELPNSHTAKTLGSKVSNVINGLNQYE